MYKMQGRVRFSECGPDKNMKIPALVNYFQDCTTENSEELGVGFDYLKEKKRAWILNAWQICIRRLPKVGEKIEVSTWATGFKGVFGPRDFRMMTEDGEELAFAHSLWVYVDTETGRPVKPEDEEIRPYETGEALQMEHSSRKIAISEELSVVDAFPVYRYHIDTNHHVNNAKYIELALEALPEKFQVTGLRVEYKKAAKYGEKMTLKSTENEHSIVTTLCDEQDHIYATVEWIGEN